MLEPLHHSWNRVDADRRLATFTTLPAGNYTLRVQGSSNHGVWNEQGVTLHLQILPPYWGTWWFRASCVAAFFALLWALYRYRLYQIEHEFNARLEERGGERGRIARELHDTLLQTIQGLMLRLQAVHEMLPPGKPKDELEQTMEVGDRAIIEGRSTVHDLRSTLITTRLAAAIRALGDELGSGNSASFRLLLEGQPRDLNPIVRDELYRIAREALRNAFAHARAKHIEAEITFDDRLLRLRIRDDGDGITQELLEAGRSGHFGLAGIRERARQIGSNLAIWSAVGAGTEIDLTIAGSIVYSKPSGGSRFARFRKKVGVSS
jgi:signal transduction histidine kinase